MKKIFSLVSILFFLQNYSFAQDQHYIDSLETQLKNFKAKKTELKTETPSLYDSTAANILYDLSKAYWGHNHEKSIEYANQSLTLSEQIGYNKGIGMAYSSIGYNEGRIGNYLSALEFHKKAFTVFKEINYQKGIARSYINIGSIYRELDNYPEALNNSFAALNIFEEIGDKKGISDCYNTIGVIHHDHGNYPEALKYYNAGLNIHKEIGDKRGVANCYNNIGIIHRDQRNYPEALNNSFASLKIKEEIGDKKGIGNTYNNIGNIYILQGNYPEGLKYLFTSLTIREEIKDKNGISWGFRDIGAVKLKMHMAHEAKDWLHKALQLGKEIESISLMQQTYEELAAADSALGNFKGAYENHKLFILYRDSIDNTANTEKIVTLQMNYDFSKKQDSLNEVQAKKDLVAQKELNKQILVRNGFIGGSILFLLLAVAAIIFFIDRMKHKRKKQMEAVRARISRDLHDDMGSTLQSISVMSEVARMKSTSKASDSIPIIEKMGSASREMIDKMNDIVWAVNPQNDDFENIILHMRAFGGELLAGKDIALHFKSDNGLISIKLSMEKRKSFFLVYKEALNNAYKYSGAKNVKVEISRVNHSLQLIVEDDGVGFSINEDRLKTGGNGLKNMKTRAAEMNGSITINSEPEHGTKVSLAINLK